MCKLCNLVFILQIIVGHHILPLKSETVCLVSDCVDVHYRSQAPKFRHNFEQEGCSEITYRLILFIQISGCTFLSRSQLIQADEQNTTGLATDLNINKIELLWCQSPLCGFCSYIIVVFIIAQDYHNHSSKY